MEILMPTSLERALVFTCCLIFAPTITTTVEPIGLNLGNSAPVSRIHFPVDDTSNEDPWIDNYPRFFVPLPEKFGETKRRSSFFPVRGKKGDNEDGISKSGTPAGLSVPPQEVTSSDGRILFPVASRTPHHFFEISHGGHDSEDVRSFPSDPQQALENAAGLPAFGKPPNFSQQQQQQEKRRSSFMPMRGRKLYPGENNLEFLERYLSSTALGSSLGPQHGMLSFPDKTMKGVINIVDQDQTAPNPKSFAGERIPSEKRALSFVPTRGRRQGSGELGSEFPPHMAAFQSDALWPEDAPVGRLATNHSENMHPRYRRASAFLPMRGRKSLGDLYGLAYNYHPEGVDQMQRFWTSGRHGTIENIGHQSLEGSKIQGQLFGGAMSYLGGRRRKKSPSEEALQSPDSQQTLRTAVVMKRPLSFFAARGKRLNGNEMSSY